MSRTVGYSREGGGGVTTQGHHRHSPPSTRVRETLSEASTCWVHKKKRGEKK